MIKIIYYLNILDNKKFVWNYVLEVSKMKKIVFILFLFIVLMWIISLFVNGSEKSEEINEKDL